MELTNDQKFVFDQVMDRLGGSNISPQFKPNFDFLTIGGYAGTGKTHLISIIRKEIDNKWKNRCIAFVAYTGKASSVLSVKLNENNAVFSDDFCGTIHSMIYKPEFKFDKKLQRMVITRWIKKPDLPFDLIFIDESSMVNEEIWKDLMEYNIPIIAVGDHGQLPPIGDNFNLMERPQFILTEIKRQSLDNPLIKLSQEIRMGKDIPFGFYDDKSQNVFKLPWKSSECQKIFNKINFNEENNIILCGMNSTRVMLNQMIRNKLHFNQAEPYPGERVVCLRNNHYNKVMNGMLGTVLFLLYEAKKIYNMTIQMDGFKDPYSGIVYNDCFGKEKYTDSMAELTNNKNFKKIVKNSDYDQLDIFDFGYCISVHKSQGSEWNKVILFEERSYYWDDDLYKKWLYTACTRAKEKLFIIS